MSEDEKIIPFKKKEGPEPEQLIVAEDGKPVTYYKYACDFKHEEQMWDLWIWARNWEDAEKRVQEIKRTLRLLGQVYMETPG